jgi:hypothetical protein
MVTKEAVDPKSFAGEVRISFTNEKILDGFETVGGIGCALVKSVANGVMPGSLH